MASARQAVQVAAVLRLPADAVPTTRGVLLLARDAAAVDDALVARVAS